MHFYYLPLILCHLISICFRNCNSLALRWPVQSDYSLDTIKCQAEISTEKKIQEIEFHVSTLNIYLIVRMVCTFIEKYKQYYGL